MKHPTSGKQVRKLDRVVIRFAGDSGDGMQLTGDRFTSETAALGNDLSTLPNFPAEIRAPQGTLPGVSSFQLHFADHDVLTPGDAPDVLVAMNPAALKANLADLPRGAMVIVDTDEFTKRNLAKVGYAANPLDDGSLDSLPRARRRADLDDRRGAGRLRPDPQGGGAGEEHVRPRACCPGCTTGRPRAPSRFLHAKFAKKPRDPRGQPRGVPRRLELRRDDRGLRGLATRSRRRRCRPAPTATSPATSRSPTAWSPARTGPAGRCSSASYPITPASDILHALSGHKRFGVTTFQAEDEIAGIGAALGAAFGGALGVTTTSGPGVALKSETIGLAVSLELPLVICDVQRGGPSTGLPTKTEQADLLQAMFGRNGEAPVPIVAPRSPADCFDAAIEAVRIATTYRTPVLLLSDGYLANGSEPWRLPDVDDAARHARSSSPPSRTPTDDDGTAGLPALPARPGDAGPAVGRAGHAGPGAPHRRHREGRRHRRHLLRPGQPRPDGPAAPGQGRRHRRHASARSRSTTRRTDGRTADVLVLGWGSTYGPIAAAVRRARGAGAAGRPGAPAPPQPVPAQHRRGAARATAGCSCRR